MKLAERIKDLLRASLASPPRLSELGKEKSPEHLEAQLEHVRRSLVQAAARENQLQDDLAQAEQEGRERDALRLRRALAELARSSQELQAVLDLIEARIETQRERAGEATLRLASEEDPSPREEAATSHSHISLADGEDQAELAARKARLAAPEEKRGTTTPK